LLCLSLALASCGSRSSEPAAGWAVGWSDQSGVSEVKILHTEDDGATWTLQTLPAGCEGFRGNDISAAGRRVAWAAVGHPDTNTPQGGILYTADGGATWTLQTLPDGMKTRHIKSIKGVSTGEAWAVSLKGDVLHTTDGGANWQLVPLRTAAGNLIDATEVNRMDVIGQNIWLVDVPSGEEGVIHSSDGGLTWRREFLPQKAIGSVGPLAISAYDSLIAWAAINEDGHLWWTSDGGLSWNRSNNTLSGTYDYDDICASSSNTVWIASNGGEVGGGFTARVKVSDGNFVESILTPHRPYMMEGVSPLTDSKVWAVGQKLSFVEPDLPMGAIYVTEDGGATWRSQPLQDNARDVLLWKISIVGARR
jgi:photosystem II stability/assembly factor-like uncharacterized protein